jgi:hypothetical protein
MYAATHHRAKALTAAGLVATACYLVWRAVSSMADRPWWLSAPAFAVELAGLCGSLALAWALWERPTPPTALATECDDAGDSVDVVVRIAEQHPHDLRSTLLAVAEMANVRSIVVADLTGGRHAAHPAKDPVARIASDVGASVVVPSASELVGDPAGLRAVAAAVATPIFLLLDAGDVPAADAVARLRAALATTRSIRRGSHGDAVTSTVTCAAVVQGRLDSAAVDSPEHGPDGRHDLLFESAALAPALGARGLAVWEGSGALVRTSALERALDTLTASTTPLTVPRSATEQYWRLSREFFATGWAVTAPADTVVARRVCLDEASIYADRVARARAARALLFGSTGVFRTRSMRLHLGHRLALLAWSVRPLSGARRAHFVALVCASLVAGVAPFGVGSATEAALVFLGLWLPGLLGTSAGLWLLSGRVLRPGDRARWSMHTLGPSVSGVRGADPSARSRYQPIVQFPHMQYGAGMLIAVIAVSTVMAMRGVSDRVTHTLGVLDHGSLVALLGVALWLLGLSLYMLRVLVRGTQARAALRRATSLVGVLDGADVDVVDLTPLGAGIIGAAAPEVGDRSMLRMYLGSAERGRTVDVPCTVRNIAARADGSWRVGLEFDAELVPSVAAAITRHCVIEPMRRHLAAPAAGVGTTPDTHDRVEPVRVGRQPDQPGSRLAIRTLAVVAVAGAVASAVPIRAAASSSDRPPAVHVVSTSHP